MRNEVIYVAMLFYSKVARVQSHSIGDGSGWNVSWIAMHSPSVHYFGAGTLLAPLGWFLRGTLIAGPQFDWHSTESS
jgi:predicted permease